MPKGSGVRMTCKECGGYITHEIYLPKMGSCLKSSEKYYCEECGQEYSFENIIIKDMGKSKNSSK